MISLALNLPVYLYEKAYSFPFRFNAAIYRTIANCFIRNCKRFCQPYASGIGNHYKSK